MPPLLPRAIFKSLLPILLLVALSPACRGHDDRPGSGSSGLIKDPVVDITGVWEGIWVTTAGFPLDSGTVTLRVLQDEEGFLTGTSEWIWQGDNPLDYLDPSDPQRCWEQSDMKDGEVDGNQVTRFKIVELLPNTSGQGLVVVRAQFLVNGNVMNGTFQVESFVDSDDRCDLELTRLNNSGLLELIRQPGS